MIEFLAETHTYIVDGEIVPSVTEVVGRMLGTSYDGVPSAVLRRKANYGTIVHDWLKSWFMGLETPHITETMKMSTDQIPSIAEHHGIKGKSAEQMVAYHGKLAGTYDLLAVVDGDLAIVDHKTTATYNEAYLRAQCSLYRLCIEDTLGQTVNKAYCLWLPKWKRVQLIPVELYDRQETAERLEEVLNEMAN